MNEFFPYTLRRNARSRRIRITVSAGGTVSVTVPRRVSIAAVEDFVREKQAWISRQVEYFKKFPEVRLTARDENKLFLAHKVRAQKIAEEKVSRLNARYGFRFEKIAIRNSKSRWGSCSPAGTLSFNYKIAFLPETLADYLVAHELCHLKERNHGERFWKLVSETVPEYLSRRKELRDFEKTFNPVAQAV